MQRFVDEWHFVCSVSCKAHLVDKKTGFILKRYDVTVDPTHIKEPRNNQIIQVKANSVIDVESSSGDKK